MPPKKGKAANKKNGGKSGGSGGRPRNRFFNASETPGKCLRACLPLTLLLAAELHSEMEVDDAPPAALETPGEPAFFSARCRLHRDLSLLFCRRFRGLLCLRSRTSRCSRSQPGALLRDARECCCLVLSCVFRVSMLDGSLCFELCLQPVVCAAAHDLTLVG